jgi:hypothetical protein
VSEAEGQREQAPNRRSRGAETGGVVCDRQAPPGGGWEKVRANNGAAGVYAVGIAVFGERLGDNLQAGKGQLWRAPPAWLRFGG